MKKTFSFDAGHPICTAIYKNKVFTGEAHCHPEDADFESERVGLYIAEVRTDINILTYIRDCELKPAYNALNHIQHSFKRSSHYNPNSYEAKHIRNNHQTSPYFFYSIVKIQVLLKCEFNKVTSKVSAFINM